MVSSLETTIHLRNWGHKPSLVGENRDNSSCWEDNDPDEESGQTNAGIWSAMPAFEKCNIKSMKFSEGRKSFEMSTNCSSEPATPAHILECLRLTKQDFADVPLLVLDYLKVYDVMDLV
ncbi:RNase H domain-containing protein [Trichonephila clavipes]|nr:RNase H domain-containing protein [Trichonephila clavipes]